MENLKYTEILQANKELSKLNFEKSISVKILSNVTINSFKELLEYSIRLKKINPKIEIGNFDNIVQDSLQINHQDIVFIFYEILNIIDSISLYFESLDDETLDELAEKIESEINIIIRNLERIPLVFFNTFCSASVPSSNIEISKLEKFVFRLNKFLFSHNAPNLVFVNLDKIIFELGRENSFDYRFYHSSKAPYTVQFMKSYIKAIEPAVKKASGKIKKALIFDCDNTLWKGIVGEDGIDNLLVSGSIASGKPFYEIQAIAKYLSKHGVIIGLCSKNNLTDVEEVFHLRKDFILTNDDIVIKKVNWNDKATNLSDIAKQLNIGIDSLVFVDDSDYEINLVKERLPEVETFQVPKNLYLYKNLFLEFIYKNFNFNLTNEDLNKTKQYKEQIKREDEKHKFTSIESYIASLQIKLQVFIDDLTQVNRISQLTQKTNQFNLTTKRYSEIEIIDFVNRHDSIVYSGSVSDKYGDSGLTILSIVNISNGNKTAIIDIFLMSCRIIGRNIEIVFLDFILNDLKSRGVVNVTATYKQTSKNEQVSDFYINNKFNLIDFDSINSTYSINLSSYESTEISYIDVNFHKTNINND